MWSVGQLSALREKISLSMHRRGKQRGRLWLCSRNVPTMEKRDFTAKEKDRSFAVEEVGGDPPTWEDEDEVNQVDGQRKLFTICGGHPYGRMSCQAFGESGSEEVVPKNGGSYSQYAVGIRMGGCSVKLLVNRALLRSRFCRRVELEDLPRSLSEVLTDQRTVKKCMPWQCRTETEVTCLPWQEDRRYRND